MSEKVQDLDLGVIWDTNAPLTVGLLSALDPESLRVFGLGLLHSHQHVHPRDARPLSDLTSPY